MPAAPRNRPDLKARAWHLRQRGRTQESIARELGVDQASVSRWLSDINRKELARLSADVQERKVFQEGVLGHLLEECLDAWERSKKPRMRVRETKGPDEPATNDQGEIVYDLDGKPVIKPGEKVTEVVQQTGDVAYVDRAFAALAALRKLLGLDVAEQPNDDGPASFAERVKSLKERAARFDATTRKRDEPPDATTRPEGGNDAATGPLD